MALPLCYVLLQSFLHIVDALFDQLSPLDQIFILCYFLVELSAFFVLCWELVVFLPVLVIHALLVVVYEALASSSLSHSEFSGILIFFALSLLYQLRDDCFALLAEYLLQSGNVLCHEVDLSHDLVDAI